MSVLSHLEPREVFRYFEEISAIPHGSGNTRAIADYCAAFARREGLEYTQDDYDNVIIVKPAAPGYENAEAVVLQGHLDMVAEKTSTCPKDMEKEGLDLAVDGDWVYAKETTLGGDDGIAVAMMLALLAEKDLPAPRLECIITSGEEIGMLGAVQLQPTLVTGRRMVNIDSEEEGIFTVGCAGGNRTCCLLPIERETVSGQGYAVTIGNLIGGHSGAEIDKGRANADILLGRLLSLLTRELPCRIVSLNGGFKDNAIPPEATAVIVTEDADALKAFAARWQQQFRREFAPVDAGLTVTVTALEQKEYAVFTAESAHRAISLLCCVPNGIQAMSNSLPGLVQTSLNLGIMQTHEAEFMISFSIRSAIASQKDMLTDRLQMLTEALGGRIEVSGIYPAWEYRPESPLRDLMCEIYREQYGKDPEVLTIHAGLECGMLGEKLPGLDAVSIGPNMQDIHTPRERMSIESTQRVWRFVREILRRSK